MLQAVYEWSKCFFGEPERPDLQAIVETGLFEECAVAIASFAARGVDGLRDTHHLGLVCALLNLRNCCKQTGCEARIRSLAPALAFCLENDLDLMEQLNSMQGVQNDILKELNTANNI